MVDFLYFGEANVYQENLDSFLAVAEELELKGLMGSGAEKDLKYGKLGKCFQVEAPLSCSRLELQI